MVYNLGEHAHSVSDQTQISWNGIIGKVQLIAEDKNILKDVQAYPNLKTGDVRIELETNQEEISSGDYRLVVSGRTENSQTNKRILPQEFQLNEMISYITVALGKDFLKWDEFNPNLYRLDFDVVDAESGASLQKRSIRIGMREIKTEGGYFIMNGQKAYLRGTLNCAEFPLKGYPDMDVESWSRIFRACRDYGLNHVRFHSWCPPAAAFVAADELGIYLQPEVSEWVYVAEPDQLNYLKEESLRMLKTYGNHPSFVFMGLGNEAGVIPESRNEFIELWGKDDRRLYTLKANANSSFTDAYDYQIARAIDDKKIRIQSGWPPKPTGSSIVVNAPNTAYDYSDITSTRDYPLVAHETVQRCVFPDTAGLDKFTGHLRAGYLEIAQDQLAERGMSELVPDFVKASGKWQVQQFKDEIEAHLRTEPFGGFQLLSLQDFPGQGTALVGVLDLFWESKGYVSGEAFREFCSPTVPLALFEKRIFVNVEPIEGDVEVSYYGPVQSPMVEINVRLLDQHGKVLKSICAGEIVLSRGINKVGDFKFNVEASEFGQKLTVVIECDGDVAGINRWNIWQFPDVDVPAPGKEILIAEKPTRKLMDQVESGSTVLLMPELKTIRGDIPQCFTSMYWNCPWTDGGETHTLGILCNEKHPVFKWFPTDEHTDWQWWSLLTKSRPMILDEWGLSESWPKSHSPIIQPIDGWNLNRKLSVLSECKVGKGRLLICSIDLKSDLDERPAARAMLKGILSYMESDSFNPSESLEAATVLKMFKD
jgi:hypothetical protein